MKFAIKWNWYLGEQQGKTIQKKSEKNTIFWKITIFLYLRRCWFPAYISAFRPGREKFYFFKLLPMKFAIKWNWYLGEQQGKTIQKKSEKNTIFRKITVFLYLRRCWFPAYISAFRPGRENFYFFKLLPMKFAIKWNWYLGEQQGKTIQKKSEKNTIFWKITIFLYLRRCWFPAYISAFRPGREKFYFFKLLPMKFAIKWNWYLGEQQGKTIQKKSKKNTIFRKITIFLYLRRCWFPAYISAFRPGREKFYFFKLLPMKFAIKWNWYLGEQQGKTIQKKSEKNTIFWKITKFLYLRRCWFPAYISAFRPGREKFYFFKLLPMKFAIKWNWYLGEQQGKTIPKKSKKKTIFRKITIFLYLRRCWFPAYISAFRPGREKFYFFKLLPMKFAIKWNWYLGEQQGKTIQKKSEKNTIFRKITIFLYLRRCWFPAYISAFRPGRWKILIF